MLTLHAPRSDYRCHRGLLPAGRLRWPSICSCLPGDGGHHAQSWVNGVSDAALARSLSMTPPTVRSPGACVGGAVAVPNGSGKVQYVALGETDAIYYPARAGGPADTDPVVHGALRLDGSGHCSAEFLVLRSSGAGRLGL